MTTSQARTMSPTAESRRGNYRARLLQETTAELLERCGEMGHVTLWQADGYTAASQRGRWFAVLTLHARGHHARHQVRSLDNSSAEGALAGVLAAARVWLEEQAA